MRSNKRIILFNFLVVGLLFACITETVSTPTNNPPTTTPTVINVIIITPTQTELSNENIINPCDLFTREDAEALLKQPVEDGDFEDIEGNATDIRRTCTYFTTNRDPYAVSAQFILQGPLSRDKDTALAMFNQDKAQELEVWGATPLDVPSLGDSAYWVGGNAARLNVLKGELYFALLAYDYYGETAPQPLIDLANVILKRMP